MRVCDLNTTDHRRDCVLCEGVRSSGPFQSIGKQDYWRCENCLATFLDPAHLPDRDFERKRYDLHDNNLDDPAYRQFLGRLLDPLLERVKSGLSGLDFGCGPGPALAAMLEEAGHAVALYDPAFYPRRSVLEKEYDFITCTEVVEHFHHPAREFRRLDGMLRPGGLLAIMTSFQDDDESFADWHYRREQTHVIFYRRETFLYLAGLYGWSCEIPARNVVILKKGLPSGYGGD